MSHSQKKPSAILFVAPHRPHRSPSQRYRIENFFSFLNEKGIRYSYVWLLSEKQDRVFYSDAFFLVKAWILWVCLLKRIFHLFRLVNYDIVFIQRESFFLNTLFFERIARRLGKRIIFDFDDAIWIPDTSEANRRWFFLKSPHKPFRSMKIADVVLAGNEWLRQHALVVQKNSFYMPTVINTDVYFPKSEKDCNRPYPVLGWTGSQTTFRHLTMLFPVLEEIYREKKFILRVLVDESTQIPYATFPVEKKIWSEEAEPDIVSSFDIGLMPLPDEEWVKGKCGLKALVCMACGVPVVASRVGVSEKIIRHGINGLLVDNMPESWKENILFFMHNPDKVLSCGKEAVLTVKKNYSVHAWKNKWLEFVTGYKSEE